MKKTITIASIIALLGIVGILSATQQKQILNKINSNDFIQSMKETFSKFMAARPADRVYLHFDKPFYKPGETIWFQAYVRNESDFKASKKSGILHVEFINPKGNTDKTLNLILKDGVASGDIALDENMPGGLFKIKAYTNWQKNDKNPFFYERDIQVQKVVLPRLKMKLDFEKESYGPGDEVVAKINLNDLKNRPLAQKEIKYTASLKGKKILTKTAQSDENGKAELIFKLPKELYTSDGLLNCLIEFNGQTESISRSIPLPSKVKIELFPEGGDLVEGMENRVAFRALNEFGKPADFQGKIVDESGKKIAEVSSFHQGMGAFYFTPKNDTKYALQVEKPENACDLVELPEPLEKGFLLMVEEVKKDFINLNIKSTQKEEVSILLQMRGKVYYSNVFETTAQENYLKIPTEKMPMGVAQITLFDNKGIERCERLVFVNKHKQLQIDIKTNKEKYQPREKVKMTISVKDERGMPMPSQLSLSVVDDKLLSFADDKQGQILSKLLLEPDLKSEVYEPNFYFDDEEPKANQALDYLLMTQGWRKFTWKEIQKNQNFTAAFPAETNLVKGRVYNRNGQPESNATIKVLLDNKTYKTDKNGFFSIPDLELYETQTIVASSDSGKFQSNVYVSNYDQFINIYLYPNYRRMRGARFGGEVFIDGVKEKNAPQAVRNIAVQKNGKAIEVEEMNLEENVAIANEVVELNDIAIAAAVEIPKEEKAKNPPALDIIEDDEILGDNKDLEPEMVLDKNIKDLRAGFFKQQEIINNQPEEIEEEIFMAVEQMPEFPGGEKMLFEYLRKNLKYPQIAKESGVEGNVFVNFIVEEDGSIKEAKVIRGVGMGLDKEATRVIKNMPNWTPGKQRGKTVRTSYTIPIRFKLDDVPKMNQADLFFRGIQNRRIVQPANAKYHRARIFPAPAYNPQDKVEIRSDFRSTIFWQGNIETDKRGKAEIEFYNSDEITAFRATVEGIGADGMVGRAEKVYYTQLPFSMDVKVPVEVVMSDNLKIPLILTNNTRKTLAGKIQLESPKAWDLMNQEILNFNQTLAANSSKTIYLNYVVKNILGKDKIKIAFQSEKEKDAFEQEIVVAPKGFPVALSMNGDELEKAFAFEISNPIKGTLNAKLTAFPTSLSDMLSGIESILREPYGCFEQTSSSTYPNIMVLQYLKENDLDDPKITAKAKNLIEKGYKRLTSYETKDKGYEWFGHSPPHEALTAYGLMEFQDMKSVYSKVDNAMVRRTGNWILSRKDGNGGFSKNKKALDSFGRAKDEITNAYIVYALSEAGFIQEIQKELDLAYNLAMKSKEPYQLGCVANALFNCKDKRAKKALETLNNLQAKNGSWNGKIHSITCSTGKGLSVETTSLAVLANLKAENKNGKIIQDGTKFIMESRSGHGGFGNTQSTIMALKALTAFSKFAKRTASSGDILIYADGKQIAQKHFEADQQGEIVLAGLEEFLEAGKNKIQIKFANTKEALPYTLAIDYTTSLPNSNPECQLNLKTSLAQKKIKMGETVRLTTQIQNKTDEGLPMSMAIVGIPAGLSPQPWQLKELQEKNQVDFYEIIGSNVVFYYRQMKPSEQKTIHLDLKADIPGNYEAPASCSYLYYTNEFKTWIAGESVSIDF